MFKESFWETLKWIIGDILVPLAVGCSAVYVAIQANHISELQSLIARNSVQPTFEVTQLHCAQEDYHPEEDRVGISVLDGKYTNYQSDICTFLVCSFNGYDENMRWVQFDQIEIPLLAYYHERENSNSLYGNIETWHSGGNYGKVFDLWDDLSYWYNNEADPESVSSVKFFPSMQTFLKITYVNLLNETETIYYLLDFLAIRPVMRIDAEYGAQQFDKFAEMIAGGFFVPCDSSSGDVAAIIDVLRSSDNLHESESGEASSIW